MAGLSIIHRGLIYRLRMFAIEHLKTPKNDENENEKPKTMDDYINCCNSDREELLKSHEKVIHKIYRSQRWSVGSRTLVCVELAALQLYLKQVQHTHP